MAAWTFASFSCCSTDLLVSSASYSSWFKVISLGCFVIYINLFFIYTLNPHLFVMGNDDHHVLDLLCRASEDGLEVLELPLHHLNLLGSGQELLQACLWLEKYRV